VFRFKFFIFLFLIVNQFAFASDSLSVLKKRKVALGISTLALTTGSVIYLNQAWFQQYNTSKLHAFNDNEEWFQMDKCGHAFTTYQTGRLMMSAMEWAGYSKKKQILIGGLSGFVYMSAIEVMDGFSDGWGFSWGDICANALGSSLAIGQKAVWNQQRIQLKFTYYSSEYAKYNPKLLGESPSTQFLKDYNGQIYWLSINPSSFIKKENKFPKWLNVAIGYGANGMIGARNNNILIENGSSIYFNRYRQGYLSLDVDLTRIKTKSKLLKSVFSCLNSIKIPFPNLELSERKLKFNYY
jgi:VanZ family protein